MKKDLTKQAKSKRVKNNDVVLRITEEDLFHYLRTEAPIEEIDAVIAEVKDRMQERDDFYFKKRSPMERLLDAWSGPRSFSSKDYHAMADRIVEDSWWDVGDQLRLAMLQHLRQKRQTQEGK